MAQFPSCSPASNLRELLERQKAAQLAEGAPNLAIRAGRIDRAVAALSGNRNRIVKAVADDFGHRSTHTTLLADIGATLVSFRHARAHLRGWMAPEKRRTSPGFLGLLGARAVVEYQPKGVVGVVSPWNHPVHLSFAPLAGIFAAGCRAMVKPSERTPRTAELIAEIVRSEFDAAEVAVATGGEEVGEAFCALPFDHLLFTGSAEVARRVARSAAENLVPLTLELGGKSPVVVGRSADLGLAAVRTMAGKLANAGQMCLAPDYAMVPRERMSEFVERIRAAVRAMYPTMAGNPDYTSVVDERQRSRLMEILRDARASGTAIVDLSPEGEDFEAHPWKVAPALVVDPAPDSLAMREEIFGPLLALVPYGSIEEAIGFVASRPRPLGLYYFGKDRVEERLVLGLVSGGATVNDVAQHVAMEDLPFGGVGASGMGAYHGIDGFRTFSHAKAVYRQGRVDLGAALRPPYGPRFDRIVGAMIGR